MQWPAFTIRDCSCIGFSPEPTVPHPVSAPSDCSFSHCLSPSVPCLEKPPTLAVWNLLQASPTLSSSSPSLFDPLQPSPTPRGGGRARSLYATPPAPPPPPGVER